MNISRELQQSWRALQQNPARSVSAARRGSFSDLIALANFWQENPDLISLGVVDVFCIHLDVNKASTYPNTPPREYVDLAFLSLLGLSKVGNFMDDLSPLGATLIQAWPGIYKWSYYFYHIRVLRQDVSDDNRRQAIDVISGAWYSVSRDSRVRQAMADTPGIFDVAVPLWMLEDSPPMPSSSNIPIGSALMNTLLNHPEERLLTKIVKITGGKAGDVAKMCLTRLRSASTIPLEPARLTVYTDVINELSYSPDHRVRHYLLSVGVISTVTQSLVAVSKEIVKSNDPTLLDAMVSLFGYLRNCVESSEGFTWVSQAINSGVISAFVDCSPSFPRLMAEDRNMILSIFGSLIPRYLVYYSVITAAESAVGKVAASPAMKRRVESSVAKGVWLQLRDLVGERSKICKQFIGSKKNRGVACDNVKCNKVDFKNNLKKCTGCLVTLYCSKECLATAWKEGDHKTVCKLKQQERQEGKLEPLTKRDKQFLHFLSIHDARQHLAHLRDEAQNKYPGLPLSSVMTSIDYCRSDEIYCQGTRKLHVPANQWLEKCGGAP